jgi:hypothetical protein
MTGCPIPPLVSAHVQAAALSAEFPAYVVTVLPRRATGRPRIEAVSRDGGSLYCLISDDASEIWRELRAH